jgi:hypothetical protein
MLCAYRYCLGSGSLAVPSSGVLTVPGGGALGLPATLGTTLCVLDAR